MKEQTVEMVVGKVCKGSVRYETTDPDAPFTNIYVSKTMVGTGEPPAKITVTVTIQ